MVAIEVSRYWVLYVGMPDHDVQQPLAVSRLDTKTVSLLVREGTYNIPLFTVLGRYYICSLRFRGFHLAAFQKVLLGRYI
jgi:hypothetical protein